MENLKKYTNILILLLLGAYIGINLFFSFVEAPLLFAHFNHRLAGEVMNTIFPYYFAIGWIIGIVIYTLVALQSIKEKEIIKDIKGFLIGLVLLIVISMGLDKTVLKIGQDLNKQYYQLIDNGRKEDAKRIKSKFKTVHAISSILNFSNFVIALYLFLYFYLYTERARKKEKSI